MSSYQKIKKHNESLLKDLTELVNNPTSIRSLEITAKIKFVTQQTNSVMFGSKNSNGSGIRNQIKKKTCSKIIKNAKP